MTEFSQATLYYGIHNKIAFILMYVSIGWQKSAIININLPVCTRLPGIRDQKKVGNLGVACYVYYILSTGVQFIW